MEPPLGSGGRAFSWLRNTALGVLVAALIGGILLPVYSDEVGWRLHERAALDGVDKMFTLLCGPNTVAQPPFWMMPARYYSAFFNSLFPDPLFVRISGILYALAWLAMLLVLIRRVTENAASRTWLAALSAGFLSLGTLPLLLVWSRPEQPIILAFTGAVLLASRDGPGSGAEMSGRTAWARSIGIVLLAAIAMSYHVKALITVPLFLVCLFLASRGRAAHLPRVAAGLVLTALAAWATYYWAHRLQCPESAVARAEFSRFNNGAAMVHASGLSQVLAVIGKALGNVSLLHYLGLAAPREEPMSLWLTPDRVSAAASFTWYRVMIGLWLAGLAVSAGCLTIALRRAWRERRLDGRIVLSLALLATILAWSASQGVRNDYEASFVVPMTVMAMVLALATCRPEQRLAAGIRVVTVLVALSGMASAALMAILYGPPLVEAAQERGYVSAQRHSISAFGYAESRRDMLTAARKCGIADPAARHALVLDDVTYFAFMQSRMPEHAAGLFTQWSSTDDPIGYLRRIKSDGVVVSCRFLSGDLRARARSEGQFCCLAPPDW